MPLPATDPNTISYEGAAPSYPSLTQPGYPSISSSYPPSDMAASSSIPPPISATAAPAPLPPVSDYSTYPAKDSSALSSYPPLAKDPFAVPSDVDIEKGIQEGMKGAGIAGAGKEAQIYVPTKGDVRPIAEFHAKKRRSRAKIACAICCTFLVVACIVVACILPFLIRVPTITIGSVTPVCSNWIKCITGGSIPINIEVEVSNPNIIGASVSAVFDLYSGNSARQLIASGGQIPRTSVGAQTTTNLQATINVPLNGAALDMVKTLYIPPGHDYDIEIDAQLTVYLGALKPNFNITQTTTIGAHPGI